MRLGYVRVFTVDQEPVLQIRAFEQARCERIYTKDASGKGRSRPEVACLFDYGDSSARRSRLMAGKTWGKIKNIEKGEGYASGCPAVSFVGDEGLVTCYHGPEPVSGASEARLNIFRTDWFYSRCRLAGGEA